PRPRCRGAADLRRRLRPPGDEHRARPRRQPARLCPAPDDDDDVDRGVRAARPDRPRAGGGGLVSAVVASPHATLPRPVALTIAEVLDRARSRLRRLTPVEAFAAFGRDAVIVDIRPAAQRALEGGLSGALVVERNVLEWRFAPASGAALPIADHDLEVVVLCQEGYT